MKDRYNLIVPDLLGHGDSEKPKPKPQSSNPYSFDELSFDLQVLFDRFAGGCNIVMGHSYGGALSAYLAYENQARVQKLVLITPVSCQPFLAAPLIYALPLPILDLLRRYLDRSFEKLALAPGDDPTLLKIESEGRILNQMFVIKALLQGMKGMPTLDVERLRMPCLTICGRLDRVIPPEIAKAFYSKIPNQTFELLSNAAHLVHLEKVEK